jgi:Raf kinase inhibitor-like YbhB/YbcL family protein
MRSRLARAVAGLALAAAFTGYPTVGALAADPFTLTSSAYKDGDAWPSKFADNRPNPQGQNACGAGENVSPPLAWANPPANAKSYAITMIDTEGGNGMGSVHWVAYDIPLTKTSFAEGEAAKAAAGWTAGSNGRTQVYSGPCPPAGAPHHYVITIIATDLEPGTIKPGLTRDELIPVLRGHALAASGLVARYSRP